MSSITVRNNNYELLKDYKNGFNLNDFIDKCTDYFDDFDYIVGDIAYNKLRMKGFYNHQNNKTNKINDYNNIEAYIKNNCATDCQYFIVKRIK